MKNLFYLCLLGVAIASCSKPDNVEQTITGRILSAKDSLPLLPINKYNFFLAVEEEINSGWGAVSEPSIIDIRINTNGSFAQKVRHSSKNDKVELRKDLPLKSLFIDSINANTTTDFGTVYVEP